MTFQKPEGVCSDGVILISFTSESFHDTFCSVLGTHVAHMGQARYPTGASTLPLLGRIYAKRLPKKLMSQYPYSCHPNTIHLISCRLTFFISYSNHPDNLLTVAR